MVWQHLSDDLHTTPIQIDKALLPNIESRALSDTYVISLKDFAIIVRNHGYAGSSALHAVILFYMFHLIFHRYLFCSVYNFFITSVAI